MGKTICVYHGNCADGFGAAWVVRKYYRGENVEFIPATYGKTPPPEVAKNDLVVIVDFSFGLDDTWKLINDAQQVILLDHHKSAIDKLSPIKKEGNYSGMLSIDHSGAMLAWNYYFPGQEPPKLLKHIEDRDLWKFTLGWTREIQANLFSYPYAFDVWDGLMAMDSAMLYAFGRAGEAIERKHFKDIHEFLNASTRWIVLGGLECPVVNCPYMWGSDAAHILAKNAKNGFAAYYWDGPDGRTFGLRSIGDMDVAKIAESYGGGGHKNASGFKVSHADAREIENSVGIDPYLQTR